MAERPHGRSYILEAQNLSARKIRNDQVASKCVFEYHRAALARIQTVYRGVVLSPLCERRFMRGGGRWSRVNWGAFSNNECRGLAFVRYIALFAFLFFATPAHASFLGQFTLSGSEEYNDNIFFSQKRKDDFITSFIPRFSLLYAPGFSNTPTFLAHLAIPAQIFAEHSDLNNFGNNILFDTKYIDFYSPALTFYFADSITRIGSPRVGSSAQVGIGPPPIAGSPPPPAQGGAGLATSGAILSNYLAAVANYKYNPNISFNASATNTTRSYQSAGGVDLTNAVGARGIYHWREEHNFHLGYTATFYSLRSSHPTGNHSSKNNVVHNLDLGDDYFSTYRIDEFPTLFVTSRSGLSLNLGGSGPRLLNTTNIAATKLWQTSSLTGGVQTGLTDSLGVAGLSNTKTFYGNFIHRFNELWDVTASVRYSMYDTKKVDFSVFQANVAMQYWISPWLSSAFVVEHRWRDGGSGSANTSLKTAAKIDGTSVTAVLSSYFDIYPRLRLGRGPLPTNLSYTPPVTTAPASESTPAPTPAPAPAN